MDKLKTKLLISEFTFSITLGLFIFIPAWDLFYWQGWSYLLIVTASILLMSLYFFKYDRSLIERRINIGPKAEKKINQKIILSFFIVLIIGLVLSSSLDHRFHISKIPNFIIIISNLMIIVAFYIFYRVFKENSFASATIDIMKEQKVISTGPYAIVRHPMYSGAIILCLFTPFALDSFLGIIPAFLLMVTIVLRILDEEKFLNVNLTGYTDYCTRTKHRLIPFIW